MIQAVVGIHNLNILTAEQMELLSDEPTSSGPDAGDVSFFSPELPRFYSLK